MIKNPQANAGDTGSAPGSGRSHMPLGNSAHAPLSLCSRPGEPRLLQSVNIRVCVLQQEKPP